MKKIFLLRHGEAVSGKNNEDKSRELTAAGIHQLEGLGNQLRGRRFVPEMIFCSPAKRTKQTAQLIVDSIGYTRPVRYAEGIYEAHMEDLFALISHADNDYQNILLIGHNPGISALANYLTNISYLSMFPGQMVEIELEMDSWEMVSKGLGKIIWTND